MTLAVELATLSSMLYNIDESLNERDVRDSVRKVIFC